MQKVQTLKYNDIRKYRTDDDGCLKRILNARKQMCIQMTTTQHAQTHTKHEESFGYLDTKIKFNDLKYKVLSLPL